MNKKSAFKENKWLLKRDVELFMDQKDTEY